MTTSGLQGWHIPLFVTAAILLVQLVVDRVLTNLYADRKPKPQPQPAAPARTSPARKQAKPAEVTITLTSTIDGEWAAEVLVGVKRTLRQAALSPSAVAQAAKLLHPEVSSAVDAVLNAARETHLARVEQLRAELEIAQKALDELTG
jgi:hypothetical protein